MPSRRQHLVQRATTWHCRIDIPADLRPAFGNRRILSTSLKTGDKVLAKELAAVQVGQWKAQFRSLREARARAGDKWREELAEKAKALQSHSETAILSAVKGTLLPRDHPETTPEAVKQRIEHTLADLTNLLNGVSVLEQKLAVPDLLNKVGAVFLDTSAHPALKLQRLTELSQEVLAHGAKASNLLPNAELAEALTISANPETYRPKSPISTSAQTQFASHLAEQNDNQRTRDVYLSHIKRFSNWLTTNGRELTFDTVADYLNTVSKVRQTRLGHLAALRKFHKWAVRYDAYYRDLLTDKRNPFEGHEHPKVGANAGKSWIAYSRQEAEQLHAAAVAKDDPDLADLIAFGCYTGCRIEELGRIRQETTIFDSAGQPVGFRVDESKTESGIREIPLHPALVPIYTRRLQKPHGATLALFPGNDKTKHGIRLNALSQRFTKLKRAEGFGNQHVFHSLRKCTATMLQRANVSPLTIPFILGHDVGNVTFDVYSAGPTFEQKQEAIQALRFQF
ncbi:DUF6538 domain-containing protein [Ectopseudomonas khazarica]|uniref:DUF6538 domain-containing protein n=1 Tax=Ectopseudomonas khazarica TaxID=2502979 RepID=UPI003B9540AB